MFKSLKKIFNTASEGMRGSMELGGLYASWAWLQGATPPAQGQAVLVLPGFTGSDSMTAPLRQCLETKGYNVFTWNGGVNMGFNAQTADHLVNRLKEVFEANGGKKISIVGHSLGGIFARELARDYPDMVEKVITLGSPFGMKHHETPDFLLRLYKLVNPNGDPRELSDADLHQRRLTPPAGVPCSSIYSETDGVVPWDSCLNPKADLCENIAVPSSHLGMIYHPLAVAAVLDRLAQPVNGWQPFKQDDYSPFYARVANDNALPQNPQWQPSKQSIPLFRK